MDLRQFDTKDAANAGATLTIKHPVELTPLRKEDGSEVTITVLGRDSDKYREITNQIQKRATQRLARAKGDLEKATDPEITKKEAILRLADTTIGWSGVELDGEMLECNRMNAEIIYTEFPFIADQVADFQEDMENFLRK